MEISALAKHSKAPVRFLQFGEGNFLRAFADYIVDIAGEQGLIDGSVCIVKPISFGNLERFHKQDNLYTVVLRGEGCEEKRLVTCIKEVKDPFLDYEGYAALSRLDTLRFVISNTTEAGITFDETDKIEQSPPNTFPGKLTKLLYERFCHFEGDPDKGLIMLPCELIEKNGTELERCVKRYAALWKLPDNFIDWLDIACVFASTLVDRIVTGYPANEATELEKTLGYSDELMVTAEPFGLWVIESERDISAELPLNKVKSGMQVIFTNNLMPYRERKVRILNGAHTSMALMSYLCGKELVLDCMKDEQISSFIRGVIFDEVFPTLMLPEDEIKSFAGAVLERFGNPYICHSLLSITLNSLSKWRARIMKSVQIYTEKKGELPMLLTFSFAALLAFYTGTEIKDGALIGDRNGSPYKVMDDDIVLKTAATYSTGEIEDYVHVMCDLTDKELTKLPGFVEAVSGFLAQIRTDGMRKALNIAMGRIHGR